MAAGKFLSALFFPPHCPFCGEILPVGQPLCPACSERLSALARTVPRRLGPKGELVCLAAFTYEGEVRERLVEMKRRENREHARAFAPLLARMVQSAVPGWEGMLVACVPGYEPQGRVYNAARVLARDMARELCLPFVPDALCLPREKRRQHTLSAYERRENVRGAFAPGRDPVFGRRVLLVDDILTTGATLCDCARALAAAGAGEVVCAVAASSPLEKPAMAQGENKGNAGG